jgi:two-component system cell cycle sensor histidine kinase/response regulator CckA
MNNAKDHESPEISWDSSNPEELLRVLFEEATDGMFITDPDGRYHAVNLRGAELTGYSREELLSMTITDVFPPEDLARDPIRMDDLRQGEIVVNERGIRRKNGSLLLVAVSNRMLPDGRLLGIVHDITEHKRIEEAIRASEERSRLIAENAKVVIWMMDMNLHYTYISPYIKHNLDYAPEEYVLKPLHEVLTPSSVELCMQLFATELEEEKKPDRDLSRSRTIEVEHIHRDGRIIWAEINMTFIRDAAGNAVGILGITSDITERKRTEEALQASEERFRSLSNASLEGIMIHDQGVILDANLAFARLFGYEQPEELIGKNGLELLLTPESRARIRQRMQRQQTGPLEVTGVRKDGTTFTGETESQPLKYMGHDARIVSCRDITQRKRAEAALRESEERYRALFDRSLDCVFLTDFEGRFLDANQAALDLLGYQRDDISTRTFASLLTADQLPLAFQTVEEIRATGHQKSPTEYRLRRKDGEHVFVETQASLIYRDGKPFAIQGIARDITERKRAEEERERLQAQLLQAQKMESVGRLAGGVAHDFNNMLTAVLGHTQLAMMKCTPSEPIHADLKGIEQSALRSADLVRQMLAFARKQTVAPKVLDLNDTVAGMLKMLRRLIGEDIEFAWMPGAGLWPVKIDPSQIDQLLANLCVNARDAIAGVGKITIKTENAVVDAAACAAHPDFVPGDFVMMAVSDDGCGIDKDVLEHIFEPFFTTKTIGTGTGLGLATVYGIVKQNEGVVTVDSDPGQGAIFKIYLPRFVGEAPKPTAESAAEMPNGRGETVLLVEDEAATLNVGKTMLERLGYTVLIAGTPGEALRQAKTHAREIQLLITDVVMPEMNGRELAKTISGIKPGLKCLFISGYTADIIAHRGVLDEGVRFLQKPFSMQDLAIRVRQALE